MNPLKFPLLADENIHPEVVRALSALGKDVLSVLEEGLVRRRPGRRLGHVSRSLRSAAGDEPEEPPPYADTGPTSRAHPSAARRSAALCRHGTHRNPTGRIRAHRAEARRLLSHPPLAVYLQKMMFRGFDRITAEPGKLGW